MADNISLNDNTTAGAILATDDISSVHYQLNKLGFGALNSFTIVDTGAGLPVNIENVPVVSLSGSATVVIASGTVTAVTDITNPVSLSGSYSIVVGTIPAVSLTGSALAHLLDIKTAVEGTLTVTGGGGGQEYTDNADSLTAGALASGLLAVATPTIGNVDSNNMGFVGMSVDRRLHVDADVTGTVSLSDSYSVLISGPLPAGTNHLGSVSQTGSISVLLSGPIPAGTNNIGIVSLSGSTSAVVVGAAAHDAAVAGNPVLNGWEARTTLPAAVGNGDAVRAVADDNGRMVNTPVAPRDLVGMLVHSATVSTTTTWLPAGGAGVFRDIIGFTIMNPSSATQATVTLYTSVTTGTAVMKFELAPNGGLVYTPSTPIPGAAANNAWGIQSNVTGVVSSIQYVNNN